MNTAGALASTIVLGCAPGISMGGSYVPEGAHPQVAWTAEARYGALALRHEARGGTNAEVSGSDGTIGALDATVLSVAPALELWERLDVVPRLGGHVTRGWLPDCGDDGYDCAHDWYGGAAYGLGLAYRTGGHGRVDVRAISLAGTPGRDWRIVAMVGLDL